MMWPALNRSLRSRLAIGLAIGLCAASCSSGPILSGQLRLGNGDFDDLSEDFPDLLAVSGAFDRAVSPPPSDKERDRQLNLFAEVFGVAYSNYVQPVAADHIAELTIKGFEGVVNDAKLRALGGIRATDESGPLSAERLMSGGLSRMLTALDPHSGYLTPDDYREMKLRTRGEFGGIGIEVTMDSGGVKVVSPIDDTPGERAGLLAGDLITHIDGTPVLGMTLSEAVRLLRGRAGSTVVLTIRRPSEAESFTKSIVRDVVRIRAVRARAEGDVGYVRVTTFNERAEQGLRAAVRDLRDEIGEQLLGLVLDLRNNPGGLLDQALGISDAFLSAGEIVSTRTRDERAIRRHSAVRGDIAKDLPIVVLINGGSASAAEIVSGALQDHDRAIVMGSPSFGKGSVQTIMPVSGGGAVRLTTARYYTPSGRAIQMNGIMPDIIAERDEDGRPREADLEHALAAEAVTDAVDTRKLEDLCPNLVDEADPILACAIDVIEARRTLAANPQN